MDPPASPLPPLPTTTATTAASTTVTVMAATPTSIHLNYPDSFDSSPRSRNADILDDPLPTVPGAKLRFMCSYGGHIIPRPHDKSLCYVGGDTRIVVVDRHASLVDLCSRLSRTLLNGRPFTLKYQLPSEDLDSLISVSTDEDLENMIEEYDRTAMALPLKPSRLRLFLFFSKPETVASMGSLLDDAKSDTWFVDALNNAGLLPRGLSDSATMDCLVNLDETRGSDSSNDLQGQAHEPPLGDNNMQVVKNGHDGHSIPDSPMVENSSSFGSSSSSPTMSNLPPIRVRVEDYGAKMQDQRVGIEEQFAQMSFGLPPPPTASAGTLPMVGITNPMANSAENTNRVFSDDERSDQSAPVMFRKPPLPLQTLQTKGASGGGGGGGGVCGGGFNLPSPDSVASDSSIASASSLSKPMYYQDQVHSANRDTKIAPVSPNTNTEISVPSSQKPIHQVQDTGYSFPPQLEQQHSHQPQQQQQPQFFHASTHYVHHPTTGHIPITSYYPIYPPPSHQQLQHHQIDQQYPVYVVPMTPNQAYNMSVQSNVAESTVLAKDSTPPLYPTKTGSPGIPEMATSLYKTAAMSSNPPLVQVPQNQFLQQQHYAGFPQMHHPSSQSIAAAPSTSGNYGFDYTNTANDYMYYSQHQAAPLPSQYQTMTHAAVAAAATALSDASKQLPQDSTQQQFRNS